MTLASVNIFLSMIPFFNLFGFEFNTSLISLGVAALAFLVGFVVGSGLKHSAKIVGVLLACMVLAGVFVPSVVSSLSGVLQLVNPLDWIRQLLDAASASILIVLAIAGIVIGLWKG
jgi:hypothetical protein